MGDTVPAPRPAAASPLIVTRLVARRDFLAANSGARAATPAFVLLVRPNDVGVARVGFTVSRKVGNAVARNRAKRRLRAAARDLLPHIGFPGTDHVLIARAQPSERPFRELVADLQQAIGRTRRTLGR